jgi:negative regulator of sigma E activity
MSSEMLSAALDGECTSQELDQFLLQIERSPELKAQWSRMCLARDALGGAQVRADQPSICEAVMRGLGDEAPSRKIVPLVARRRTFAWQPMASLATAAAVAAVAFTLGYRSPSVPAPISTAQAPAVAATVVATTARAADEVAAVQSTPAVTPVRLSSWESLEEGDARQLNTYLIDYSSYRAGAGMADTLGYARFAAHTAEYNADR